MGSTLGSTVPMTEWVIYPARVFALGSCLSSIIHDT
jgi:hypothetical protein